MNSKFKLASGVAIGALLGAGIVWFVSGSHSADGPGSDTGKTPLYWVAPMDPNYQRDKPGKSPMGMDLIPVFADENGADGPGTVRISAGVVNNLGVRTALVERGRLESAVHTVGYVQYDENHRVDVSPRVEGWIEKLHIKAAGDPVTRGAPLFDLYSPMLVNAQEELLLALRRGNAVLIDAAAERLRALQLTESDIERLRKRGRVSRTIAMAAPQSGVVEHLGVREGMYIKPGMSVMTISAPEHIWVVGEVFERQAALVNVGDQVDMQFDYLPGRRWVGSVDYIYPALNASTRTAQVRVHFDNKDGVLKPGMFAQITIDGGRGEEALLLPREALIRTGRQARAVLAMGDGKFKSVQVEVGRIGADQVEVRSGLKQGDRIVTSAQFLIDSESSKTSDFKRMGDAGEAGSPTPDSAWVVARIENVMLGHRMLTLAHPAIDAWQWPAMTMDFAVDESVDLQNLVPGMSAHFELTRIGTGDTRITSIRSIDANDGSDPGIDSSAKEIAIPKSSKPEPSNTDHEGHTPGDTESSPDSSQIPMDRSADDHAEQDGRSSHDTRREQEPPPGEGG